MSKQKYPDLTPLRVCKYSSSKKYSDVLVLYKNGAQYHVCDVEGKYTFHATEAKLTEMVERAAVYSSPLYKALE